MKNTITKSDWIAAQQCIVMAWFGLRAASSAPNEAELFRMQQGQEIGNRARELYPNGVLVSRTNGNTPAEVTQHLITDTSIDTLFEAAVVAGPFVARADILKRHGAAAWHVLEVKSSFSDTTQIKELVDDLAYTAMVLQRAGLQIAKASLVLLSRQYRFGDGTNRLFDIVEKTVEVNARVAAFNGAADPVAQVLFGDTPPPPALVSACRSCAFFDENCMGSGLTHTVLEIPGLHHTKLKRLSLAGIVDLSLVPNDLNLNEQQERAKNAALTGRIAVEPGLATALASVQWPCYYLDFETVATVLPLYHGHGCHRQVLTQFSIHHRERINAEADHAGYLADASRDCERELADALIARLGDRGSIFVYSNFEEVRIKALRDTLPDLATRLQAIIDRLEDLLQIIKANVYHPNFRGSFSIKTVLPALVPELSYAGLDVKDGDTAITRFARMARGEISGDAVEITRQQLLEYCKMDTFAMVRLHDALCYL